MTLGELRAQVFLMLGTPSDGSGYYTTSEVIAALNRATAILSAISLSSVTTMELAVSPGALLVNPISADPNYLLPLNVYCDGEMALGSLRDVQARDPRYWTARPATPELFVPLAPTAVLLYPRPALGATLSVRYARIAPTMAQDASVPDVPPEFHPALADAAAAFCRAKVGYQGDIRSRAEWARFMDAARRALAGSAERVGQRTMPVKEIESVLQSIARIQV